MKPSKTRWVGPLSEACHGNSAKFDSNNRFVLIPSVSPGEVCTYCTTYVVCHSDFFFSPSKSDSISIRSVPLSHFVPWKMILRYTSSLYLLLYSLLKVQIVYKQPTLPLLSSPTQFATRNVRIVYGSVCRQIP